MKDQSESSKGRWGRSSTRRRRARSLWAAAALLVVSMGVIGPERAGAAVSFSLVDGGHQGTSATGGAHSVGVGGSGPLGAPAQTGGEGAPLICQDAEPMDVLFIGNSYTHYYDMPTLLEDMAESAGCRIRAEMVAPGGSRLKLHANYGETLSAIGSRSWDAVVLQNFSQLPSHPVATVKRRTFPHVQKLVDAIRQSDPRTDVYFYVTWGRRDGDVDNCADNPLVCTFEGHSAALHRGYSLYAEAFDGHLVDVGGAWARVAEDGAAEVSHPSLYNRDGSHPSLAGSYLAASVFFATLKRASPLGLSYPQGLSEDSARYIQRIAGSLPLSGA